MAGSPASAEEIVDRAVRGTLLGSAGSDAPAPAAGIEVGESAVRVGEVLLERR